MKKQFYYIVLLMAAFTFTLVSCSDDDDNVDPQGTTYLNMMNEQNGKTRLGNSDIFIDQANNFTGSNYSIVSLGRRNGFAGAPEPKGAIDKVAVISGNAYQVFEDRSLVEFPSGAMAIPGNMEYYNLYVISDIKHGDEIVGANVKFVSERAPDYDLPEYDSDIDETLNYTNEIRIPLSTSDFEYHINSGDSELSARKDGNDLVIALDSYEYDRYFEVYIRIRESYTVLYGMIRI